MQLKKWASELKFVGILDGVTEAYKDNSNLR